MSRLPRRLLATATAALLALPLAACGGGDSGGDESGLVVYSGRNEQLVGPLLQKFTAETGIKVTPRYGGSPELAAQLLEEGDRTPADVFFAQDAGALGALQDQGRFAPIPQTTLDKVDARFRSPQATWVGVSGRARVLVYNPSQVPTAQLPTSVFDLTGPEWKGKVGIAPTNGSFQAFVTAMRVTAGEDRARQFLTGLKANEPKIFENNVRILEAVAAGQVPVGLANHYYLHEKAAELGGLDKVGAKNHYFTGGDPGALVNVAGVGVLKGTDRAPDAQRLVDYLLSQTGQEYFAGETSEYPLVAGTAKTAPGIPPLASIQAPKVDLASLDTLEQTQAMLRETGLI